MSSLAVLSPDFAARQRELGLLDAGEIRFGRHDQLLYSIDASLNQIEPIGVVLPETVEQIQRLNRSFSQHRAGSKAPDSSARWFGENQEDDDEKSV